MGGKRCAGLGRLLVPIALLCASAACAEEPKAAPSQAPPSSTIIVLDGSRSMWARVGGQSKVALVRTTLGQVFATYEDRIAFGLVAFGHRGGGTCTEAELLAKPGELSSKTPGKLLFGAGFKPKTTKPIAAALVEAAKQTQATGLDVVLITDGLDSCKANVCATAKSLKQAAPGLHIHVIGFDPKAKQSVKGLSCVAQDTGGQFLTAANSGELKQDLTAVLDAVAKQAALVAQGAATTGALPAPAAPPSAPTPPPPPATPTAAAAAPLSQPSGAQAQPSSPPPQASAAPSPSAPTPETSQSTKTAPIPAPQAQTTPTPAPPAQSAQAKSDPAQGASPSTPQRSELAGPPAPGQTDMPKVAGLPPTESAAPAWTPPSPSAGPSAPVPVTFKALLTEGGPQVKSGLIWRVFTPQLESNGARKLVSTHHEARPTAALLPGEYLVNAAYGLSNLTKKIKVESGRSLEETFVLNTGGLKLAAVLANGDALPGPSVHFDILSDEEDQFGNRHKTLEDAKSGVVIRLNAGAYHLVSTYGDANATVRADVTVEPGKITEATVKHAAAAITFKLVQRPGGEALADTQWSILTPTGDVVKENTGALPTHILAAGNYAVVASHNGESYTNKFSVVSGQTKQIEVVMQEGPASPEALKAITEPPPPPPAPPPGESAASPGAPESPGTSGVPPSPDSGMAFGGGESAMPREPGLLPNPGALLRPRLP
jgi:von Willebrand factor type A domain